MHLFKVHGKRENDKFQCLWKGCVAAAQHTENGNILASESGIRRLREFEDEDKWKRHIEKKHITRYAWHMGDGPMNSLGKAYRNINAINDAQLEFLIGL